jgi:uncharacterized membrane protein
VDGLLFALTLATALGCALSAGALFAFSSFVMAALARLPGPRGVEAMQSINVMAPTPAFMAALFGSALACAVLAVWGALTLDEDYGPWLLAGGVLYILGTPGLTMAYHVPRNNALAALDASGPEAEAYWATYRVEWTRMNHLRVAAGIAAAGLLTVAMSL